MDDDYFAGHTNKRYKIYELRGFCKGFIPWSFPTRGSARILLHYSQSKKG